jgi:hypothetical protein
MTPRTVVLRVTVHEDIAAILHTDEIVRDFKRLARQNWGSGVAIEAEAASTASDDEEADE